MNIQKTVDAYYDSMVDEPGARFRTDLQSVTLNSDNSLNIVAKDYTFYQHHGGTLLMTCEFVNNQWLPFYIGAGSIFLHLNRLCVLLRKEYKYLIENRNISVEEAVHIIHKYPCYITTANKQYIDMFKFKTPLKIIK